MAKEWWNHKAIKPTSDEIDNALNKAELYEGLEYTLEGARILLNYEEQAQYFRETIVKGRSLEEVSRETDTPIEVLEDALNNPKEYSVSSIFLMWMNSGITVSLHIDEVKEDKVENPWE